ncbi:hypothetical protein PP178_00890 [Zeaxanthinibacter sp. PT1]|uniref:hypothetical protein n=1 Tax=Zeaxanthinibacter TaxID=561554 RepID=UPI00234A7E4D|nr:hypothetical protein [Zeaxanthinibacter sp. PT1]MDC6350092.1 hypothetical protein [Zeaxanthinibacter sp. PT1]
MALVLKSSLTADVELTLNEINIRIGSGVFLIEGGVGNKDKGIKIFYHKPKNFNKDSKFLLVIPGAGRNADSYRDAWIEESEKYSVLILSPMYPEKAYGFEDYHLAGLLINADIQKSIEYVEDTNIAQLDEEQFSFDVNTNSGEWIFNDFDRIFELVSKELGSEQTSYDIWGHSAGGHILHRFGLFHSKSKANIIIPANASFYTLPSFETPLPFGIKDTPLSSDSLKMAFKKKVVIFLGEMDNENETGGTFLRSETADQQGLHRLSRGKYFFKTAEEKAKELGYEFNWKLVIVPDVGHDHEMMGNAAGAYLYSKN